MARPVTWPAQIALQIIAARAVREQRNRGYAGGKIVLVANGRAVDQLNLHRRSRLRGQLARRGRSVRRKNAQREALSIRRLNQLDLLLGNAQVEAQRCLQLRRPFSSLTETGIRKHQVLFGPRHRHIEQPVGFMSLAASDLFTNFSVIPVALLVTGRWIHPLRA